MEQRSAQHGTPVSDVGEFGLIAHMRQALGRAAEDDTVAAGIADDAAVIRIGEGRAHVVTTDALIEGTHFDRSFMPLGHLGVKAVAVNVSDIVAMNARPRYATVTLGLPQSLSVEMVGQLYEGIGKACEAYGVTVVGGDTTSARQLVLSVTVIGEALEEDVVYRGGARVGDVLCVTGDLGASYAGLKVLAAQRQAMQDQGEGFAPDVEAFTYVIQRHLAPTARLAAIKDWKKRGVRPHALIDISDGLASEVHHVCEASGTGALLRGAALPFAPETRGVADAFGEDVDTYGLFGGEDYELLFALPEGDLEKLDPESFITVGEVTDAEDGVRIETAEGETLDLRPGGFQHFGDGGEG